MVIFPDEDYLSQEEAVSRETAEIQTKLLKLIEMKPRFEAISWSSPELAGDRGVDAIDDDDEDVVRQATATDKTTSKPTNKTSNPKNRASQKSELNRTREPKEAPKPNSKSTQASKNLAQKIQKMVSKSSKNKIVSPKSAQTISPNGRKAADLESSQNKGNKMDFSGMVFKAIETLNEDGGSTRESIAAYLMTKMAARSNEKDVKKRMRQALRKFVKIGSIKLIQAGRNGHKFSLRAAV